MIIVFPFDCDVLQSQPGGIKAQGAVQRRARAIRDGDHQGTAEGAKRGVRSAGRI